MKFSKFTVFFPIAFPMKCFSFQLNFLCFSFSVLCSFSFFFYYIFFNILFFVKNNHNFALNFHLFPHTKNTFFQNFIFYLFSKINSLNFYDFFFKNRIIFFSFLVRMVLFCWGFTDNV